MLPKLLERFLLFKFIFPKFYLADDDSESTSDDGPGSYSSDYGATEDSQGNSLDSGSSGGLESLSPGYGGTFVDTSGLYTEGTGIGGDPSWNNDYGDYTNESLYDTAPTTNNINSWFAPGDWYGMDNPQIVGDTAAWGAMNQGWTGPSISGMLGTYGNDYASRADSLWNAAFNDQNKVPNIGMGMTAPLSALASGPLSAAGMDALYGYARTAIPGLSLANLALNLVPTAINNPSNKNIIGVAGSGLSQVPGIGIGAPLGTLGLATALGEGKMAANGLGGLLGGLLGSQVAKGSEYQALTGLAGSKAGAWAANNMYNSANQNTGLQDYQNSSMMTDSYSGYDTPSFMAAPQTSTSQTGADTSGLGSLASGSYYGSRPYLGDTSSSDKLNLEGASSGTSYASL
jgi:hypothetical protein